jgi:DNA-binding MarR family transcriptional regulator
MAERPRGDFGLHAGESLTVPGDQELVDAFLTASRVLVALAVRSLAAADTDVTLPQYRVLVVLASRGSQRISELAESLAVNSSSATRMCDRLESQGLIRRQPSSSDRRVIYVEITKAGRRLVDQVTQARRAEIGTIVQAMPSQYSAELIAVLRAFSDAAGEVPEQNWSLGWGSDG